MANGFLGSGDVYIDRLTDAGVSSGGFIRVGNATVFSLEPQSEERQRVSRGRDDYGVAKDSVRLAQPAVLSITFDEIDEQNLALALMGTLSKENTAAAPFTDQAVVVKLDQWVPIGTRINLDTSVTVTNSAATTTYVENTHYELNRRLGLIRAISGVGGGMTEGQSILVDGTERARTDDVIQGGVRAQIKIAIRLDGKNQVNGQSVIVEVYEANLSPSSAFDFLAEDFATLELQGSAIKPANRPAPYVVRLRT